MCTLLILRCVLVDCAFSTWECLRHKEVTNIYHFCYNLQLNFMFYYIKVAFLMCILQCATRSKVQIPAHYTELKSISFSLLKTKQFSLSKFKL